MSGIVGENEASDNRSIQNQNNYGTAGTVSEPSLKQKPKWIPKRRMTVMAVLISTIGSFGLGTVLTWSAIALKEIEETKYFGEITKDQISWIASLALLGALISAPFTGFLISFFGRKKTMLFTALPCVFGWLLVAFSQNLWMLYAGRFITGFCGGAFTVAIPAYVSEVTEDRIRGTLGTVMILMLCTGIEFTYIVGAFVTWFWLSIICSIIPVIFFISMLFMPESPRYLLIKRQPSQARKALKWLRRASTKKHIEPEMSKIEDSVAASSGQSSKFTDLLTPSVLKPIGISTALMFFGQLSGVNGLSLYTVQVFEDAGTTMDGRLASIIIGGCQVLTVLFVPFVLIETLGRKTLLLISESIMVVGLIAFGTFFYLKGEGATPESLSWLPLTSLIAIIIGYNIGMGPLPWVVTNELLPHHVRDLASSIITVFYWVLSFVAGKTFQDIGQVLGNHGLYWLCAGVCVAGFLFVLFFVPETKGTTSEEIQTYFGYKKPEEPSGKNVDVELQGSDLSSNPDVCAVSETQDGFVNPAFDA